MQTCDIEDKLEKIKAARAEHTALIRDARFCGTSLARSIVRREAGRVSLRVMILVDELRTLLDSGDA